MARAALSALASLVVLGGCLAPKGGEIDGRFVSVHNTLVALGHAQTGPHLSGSLGEGRDARHRVELPAGCATFVAFAAGGLRNVDVAVVDAHGARIAEDTTKDRTATVRVCTDTPATFTVVVRAAEGAGDYALGQWSGVASKAAPGASGDGPREEQKTGAGTCEAPNTLALDGPLTVSATNARGLHEDQGACGGGDGAEVVYRFELATRKRVTVELDAKAEMVLYLRKDQCGETDAEVVCADESSVTQNSKSGGNSARIDEVLEPGQYFLFVDGGGSATASYRLDMAATDVPKLEEECAKARPLTSLVRGTLRGGFNFAATSCGDESPGRELLHRVDLPARVRVRVVETSSDFSPVVSVRRKCPDATSEVGCGRDGIAEEAAAFTGILDPGSYAVLADAEEAGATGAYSLSLETASENGSGIQGDGCSDAVPVRPAPHTTLEGDTFLAKDDVQGRCGGQGAADAVYRIEIPRRTRLLVKTTSEESSHVLVLQKSCGDRATEVACGPSIDATLTPGTYFMAVDGASPDAFGKYALDVTERDLGVLEAACNSASPLRIGVPTKSTLAGPHRFTLACAGRADLQSGSDRVFKLTLAASTKVRFELATAGWDGFVSVLRSCVDSGAPGKREVCGTDKSKSPLSGTFEAGTYWVVVAGRGSAAGPFTLTAKAAP